GHVSERAPYSGLMWGDMRWSVVDWTTVLSCRQTPVYQREICLWHPHPRDQSCTTTPTTTLSMLRCVPCPRQPGVVVDSVSARRSLAEGRSTSRQGHTCTWTPMGFPW